MSESWSRRSKFIGAISLAPIALGVLLESVALYNAILYGINGTTILYEGEVVGIIGMVLIAVGMFGLMAADEL